MVKEMFIRIYNFSAYSSTRANFGKLFQGKSLHCHREIQRYYFLQLVNDQTVLEIRLQKG